MEQGWPVGLVREDVATRSANLEPGAFLCQVPPGHSPRASRLDSVLPRQMLPAHGGSGIKAGPKDKGSEGFLLPWEDKKELVT